jgi:beta-glucosidase
MAPPDSTHGGSFRDHLKTNVRKSTSKGNQRYAPLHEAIPEEISSLRSPSEFAYADTDSDSDLEKSGTYKLRPVDRYGSHHFSAYIPVIRDDGGVETYLDSITEAEQELLSASNQYDFVDDSDDLDSDEETTLRYKLKDRLKRRRARLKAWTPVKYARIWWRTLVAVIVTLAVVVWGFLSFAVSHRQEQNVWVSAVASFFPLRLGADCLADDTVCFVVSIAKGRDAQALGGEL